MHTRSSNPLQRPGSMPVGMHHCGRCRPAGGGTGRRSSPPDRAIGHAPPLGGHEVAKSVHHHGSAQAAGAVGRAVVLPHGGREGQPDQGRHQGPQVDAVCLRPSRGEEVSHRHSAAASARRCCPCRCRIRARCRHAGVAGGCLAAPAAAGAVGSCDTLASGAAEAVAAWASLRHEAQEAGVPLLPFAACAAHRGTPGAALRHTLALQRCWVHACRGGGQAGMGGKDGHMHGCGVEALLMPRGAREVQACMPRRQGRQSSHDRPPRAVPPTDQLAATSLGRAAAPQTRTGWTAGRRRRHAGPQGPSSRLPLPDAHGRRRPRCAAAPMHRARRCWWACCQGAAPAGAAPAVAAAAEKPEQGGARPTGIEPAFACCAAATAGRAGVPAAGLQVRTRS